VRNFGLLFIVVNHFSQLCSCKIAHVNCGEIVDIDVKISCMLISYSKALICEDHEFSHFRSHLNTSFVILFSSISISLFHSLIIATLCLTLLDVHPMSPVIAAIGANLCTPRWIQFVYRILFPIFLHSSLKLGKRMS